MLRKNYFCEMPVYTDQLGDKISLNHSPLRIVSLVPSQSEFLWDIGLREELVGITKFCIHPSIMFQKTERIGGTKQLNLEKIKQLNPDLIIGNKEENDQEQINTLRKDFPVWMSDIYTLDDAFDMMVSIGIIVSKENESQSIVNKLKMDFSAIKNLFNSPSILYLIWNKPYMGAASKTFIDNILSHIGCKNVLSVLERYPVLDEKMIQQLNPSYCFLSSEPFPFNKTHESQLQKIIPNSKVMKVDGELFSWYGSRLLQFEKYVRKLNQELIGDDK